MKSWIPIWLVAWMAWMPVASGESDLAPQSQPPKAKPVKAEEIDGQVAKTPVVERATKPAAKPAAEAPADEEVEEIPKAIPVDPSELEGLPPLVPELAKDGKAEERSTDDGVQKTESKTDKVEKTEAEDAGDAPKAVPVGPEPDEEVPAAVPVTPENESAEGLKTWVPDEVLDDYFAGRPDGLLVDPQHLLGGEEFRKCNGFLEKHAQDSRIDLVVYLFGPAQKLPKSVPVEQFVKRTFKQGRPAALVLYYFGEPQRTRVLLSPHFDGVVSAAECRRSAEGAIAQALESSEPVGQLLELSGEMSVRLYWMEGVLLGGKIASGDEKPMVTLPERGKALPDEKGTDKIEKILATVMPWLQWAMATMACLVAFAAALWLWKRFFQYRFTEQDVFPRLGGEAGAGIGPVIRFDSISRPPSLQRKQMRKRSVGL